MQPDQPPKVRSELLRPWKTSISAWHTIAVDLFEHDGQLLPTSNRPLFAFPNGKMPLRSDLQPCLHCPNQMFELQGIAM